MEEWSRAGQLSIHQLGSVLRMLARLGPSCFAVQDMALDGAQRRRRGYQAAAARLSRPDPWLPLYFLCLFASVALTLLATILPELVAWSSDSEKEEEGGGGRGRALLRQLPPIQHAVTTLRLLLSILRSLRVHLHGEGSAEAVE